MSYTQRNDHLVFWTKDRRPWPGPEVLSPLREYLGGIIPNLGGQWVALLERHGVPYDERYLTT